MHKGVCLGYEFDSSFIEDNRPAIIGLDTVTYGPNLLGNWLIDADIENIDAFVQQLARKVLSSKAEVWKYEEEVRIIRRTPGSIEVPRGVLVDVVFGLRTPPEQVELITEFAKQYSGCNKFGKVIAGDSDFTLAIDWF